MNYSWELLPGAEKVILHLGKDKFTYTKEELQHIYTEMSKCNFIGDTPYFQPNQEKTLNLVEEGILLFDWRIR